MDIRIIIASIFLLTLTSIMLAPFGDSGTRDSGCNRSGCHGSEFYQYINILPDHEKASIPDEIEEGESALFIFVIENECSESDSEYNSFEWTEITLTIDNDYITASRYLIRGGKMAPGTRAFSVTLTCKKVVPVVVRVDAVGHNSHEKVKSYDSFTFVLNSLLTLSTYSIEPDVGNHTIDLMAKENIDLVEVNVSTELDGLVNITPMKLTNISGGSRKDVLVSILDSKARGAIYFNWWSGNKSGSLILDIEAPRKGTSEVGGEDFVLMGRIAGISSLILLLISTLLCLNMKKWRMFVIRKLKKRRKVIHCYVSYGIVVVSIFHLVVLMMEGKYSSSFVFLVFMSGNNAIYYNLGHIALYVMIVLGLTGIYQKPIMKRFKKMGHKPYRSWSRLHLALCLLALALVIVHMLKIGTDFNWLQ